MAGTINLALSQQLDDEGNPLADGRLYFIRAGTVSTPQNAFYDSALTLPLANPYTLDSAGRIPFFFLADGTIKIVLIDKHGNTQLSVDNVPVVGSSSGGGGGTVDPTTVWQTGDVKYRYGTGTLSGFVRLNSRTIGSATSGATERANSDCQALFLYLWATDTNLTVSTGRGLTAAADWAANKTITLPDGRARMLAGLADMGNSNSGALASNTFLAGNAVTLGSALGAARTALQIANLPAFTPSGSVSLTIPLPTVATTVATTVSTSVTTSITDPGHAHNVQVPQQGATIGSPVTSKFFEGQNTTGATVLNVTTDTASTGITASSSATSTGTSTANSTASWPSARSAAFTGDAQGGTSTQFDIFSPALLVTLYIKL